MNNIEYEYIETKSLIFTQTGIILNFDFVVAGAGSAGCAVANRLSACGKYSVALIEAGGKDNNPWIHVPVGYFKTLGNPKTDWRYVTQPDDGLNGRSIPWPRGRVLGGSSSINGLLYVRGQPQDFNHWRQLGNTGWGWDDVLPYFKRAENWKGNSQGDMRGKTGPLSVSPTRLKREVVDKWIEAAIGAGYRANPDYNSEDQEGVASFQLTSDKGRRCSSAVAYLRPIRSRKNLTVLTNTQIEKLAIKQGCVTGLIVRQNGQPAEITVNREVVLSAGSIGSPQILMLSGIGDSTDLQKFGIEMHRHLPGVGRNLQDHLQARPIFKTDLSTMNTETNSLFKKAMIGLQYIVAQTGPMTMAASLGTGFLKTHPDLETPDIQFHIQPFSANNAIEGTHPFSAFTTSVLQLRPESTGQLRLKSADFRDHPDIHPNYLATKLDQQTIVEGIKIARRIARFEPLKSHVLEEYQPGAHIGINDDTAILEWARNTAVTIYHPTGTCKMGRDPMAVVDERLRAHGIKGLRVADASIMPTITSGNTNAPAIMIGEKVSDMVLEDAA